MKIAFLNIYQNKVGRGAESYVEELYKRLSINNSVEIITDYNIDWSHADMSGTWRRVFFVDYWSLLIARFTLSSIPVLLRKRFDIVIPLNGGWQVAIVRIITWLYGGKMVVSGQSGMGWDDRNNLWAFPNVFIALSSKALNWAKNINPFVKSVYIPNGVDLNRFVSHGPSFKSGLNRPVILAVGAFTEQKRLDLAITAVSKLKNASLLLVGGGGDLKNDLQEKGRMLLGGRFKIITVPFEKMPEVYRCADVFTLPSASSEAFGNVLVEAMASGLPVIATNDKIRKEIVGEAGILVDPTDTEAYLQALQKALDTKWGNKPRKQSEKFSWDLIVEHYEELFKNLLNQK